MTIDAAPVPVNNGHPLLTRSTCPCDKQRDHENCPTCDWGLGICAVCGAAEIDLRIPCTGRRLAQDA
jgi:hypothetical protein